MNQYSEETLEILNNSSLQIESTINQIKSLPCNTEREITLEKLSLAGRMLKRDITNVQYWVNIKKTNTQ